MEILSLEPFNIVRPEKVRWWFPPTQDILSGVKSKSLRKFFSRAELILQTYSIRLEEKIVDRETFSQWLPFYEQKMRDYNHEVIASLEKYDSFVAAGEKIIGLFFTQNEQLVGSGIITVDAANIASFAYAACERIDLGGEENASMGSLVDYYFLKMMKERGIEKISAGTSRNAFGVVNTVGYLDYKLRLGYFPTVEENCPLLSTVPLNEKGNVAFLGIQNESSSLYIRNVTQDNLLSQIKRFASQDLPCIEL